MSHLAAGKMRGRSLVAGCQFAQLNVCAVLVLRAEGRAGVGRKVPVSCRLLCGGQTVEKQETGREPWVLILPLLHCLPQTRFISGKQQRVFSQELVFS